MTSGVTLVQVITGDLAALLDLIATQVLDLVATQVLVGLAASIAAPTAPTVLCATGTMPSLRAHG